MSKVERREVVRKAQVKYRLTEKYREKQKKARKKYFQSEKGIKTLRRYEQTKSGKIKVKNRRFIHNHLVTGDLIKSNKCDDCGCTDTEFHHIRYYIPPRLTDIAEVCHECHVKRHEKGEGIVILPATKIVLW